MTDVIQLAACAVVSATFSGILVSMVMAGKIRKTREEQKQKATRVEPSITAPRGVSASVREGTERALRSSPSSRSSASTDHGFAAGVTLGSISSDSSSSCSSSSSSFSSCD